MEVLSNIVQEIETKLVSEKDKDTTEKLENLLDQFVDIGSSLVTLEGFSSLISDEIYNIQNMALRLSEIRDDIDREIKQIKRAINEIEWEIS